MRTLDAVRLIDAKAKSDSKLYIEVIDGRVFARAGGRQTGLNEG